ncbi:hypothetical protein HYV58_00570 [Candidatus Peregrinibacteria bacterium]|nr:hypothetical protein [Candidatus Peregrinibacteria bacterium]
MFLLMIAFVAGVMLLRPEAKTYALEAGWNITAPSSVTLSAVNWSLSEQQTTLTFDTAIQVSNDSSTSQGFTARVKSTELIHQTDPTLFMGYTKLEIKTGSVSTSQPDGISAPIQDTYTAFSGSLSTSDPINFMTADARSRNAGSWSITPAIRLTIPSKQRAGAYQATLTFEVV